MNQKADWTPELEDEIDSQFIQRVANEVQQSCALPLALPTERIPAIIINCAQFFWERDDRAVEERALVLRHRDICKHNAMTKIVCLPPRIVGVFGCYRIQDHLKYSTMGDFSIERMMMSSYSMFGGSNVGSIGGSINPFSNGVGYTLSDVVTSLYEIDQFDQTLNPPLTYNFNRYSGKLNIIGDSGYSDILIQAWVRCKIQDLYNNYYFFRYVVCQCKKALSTIYGAFEFTLPGGVSVNYSMFSDEADSEIDKIEEWLDNNCASGSWFFMPNQV